MLALGNTFSGKQCFRSWPIPQKGGFLGLVSLLRYMQLSVNMEIAVISR